MGTESIHRRYAIIYEADLAEAVCRFAALSASGCNASVPSRRAMRSCVISYRIPMGRRSSAHAKQEKVIFDAFLEVHRSLGVLVRVIHQPDDEFPDIQVKLADGTAVDFELAEWLDGAQMAAAKQRESLGRAILAAIGQQGVNPSRHFRAIMLSPNEGGRPFDPADADPFRAALFGLIQHTEQRWPAERSWHSPQGHSCRDLHAHPPLDKYLASVIFDPRVVRGEARRWPPGQPHIFMRPPGGWYSPETALRAMAGIIEQKLEHYGPLPSPTRLLVYYGKAYAYNTPYYGTDTRDFAEIAERAASVLPGQIAFDKIYLFKALEPGAEAFEIYPTCVRVG